MTHPDHYEPDPPRDSTPAACPWTLGLDDDAPCGEAAGAGHLLCQKHRTAERAIAAKARAYKNAAAGLLEADKPVEKKALRAAGDPRRRAEEWWLRKTARHIPEALRRQVLGGGYRKRCTYCGGRWADVIDHILPVTRGGRSNPPNLTPACHQCNSEKSDRTPEEWRAWRIEQELCWPPESWNRLVDQAIRAMVEDDCEPLLRDLAYPGPDKPAELPERWEDDPRWQRAKAVLLGDLPDLTSRERWLLQRAAILVQCLVELEYVPACKLCGIALELHSAGCGIEVWDPDEEPAQWVLDLGRTDGTCTLMPVAVSRVTRASS